jgi:hypothetical protein
MEDDTHIHKSILVMGKSILEMERSKPKMVMNTQVMGSYNMEMDNSFLELGHILVNNWAIATQWHLGPSSTNSKLILELWKI